jgi:predicted Zn-dependent protease
MRIWAKKLPQAVEAAKLALAKSPESPEPAMLALELLSLGESQAEDLVLQALKKNSQPNLQLSYARVLIDSQRLSDALVQLQKLSQEMPHFLMSGCCWVPYRSNNHKTSKPRPLCCAFRNWKKTSKRFAVSRKPI